MGPNPVEAMVAMTVVRLSNGGDVSVKLSVEETLAAIGGTAAGPDFVELPGEDGPFHLRPSAVIAVLGGTENRSAGFRMPGFSRPEGGGGGTARG